MGMQDGKLGTGDTFGELGAQEVLHASEGQFDLSIRAVLPCLAELLVFDGCVHHLHFFLP